MKQRSGLYPRLSVDDAGSQLVSQAGAVALMDTVRVVGLDTALSAAVGPCRKPLEPRSHRLSEPAATMRP